MAGWVLLFSFFITELSMLILLYTTDNRTFSIYAFEIWNTGFFSELAGLSLIQLTIGMSVSLAARLLMARRSPSVI
jgi:iron(III) transport system permease protein